jgi:hypothetical protein
MENKVGDTQIALLLDRTISPFSYIGTKFIYDRDDCEPCLLGVYQIQIINTVGNDEKDLKKMTLDVFYSNRWLEERFVYSKNVNVE